MCVCSGNIWEMTLLSIQFCYEPKIALKLDVLLKEREKSHSTPLPEVPPLPSLPTMTLTTPSTPPA